MRKLILLILGCMSFFFMSAQNNKADSIRNFKKDSTLRAAIHADSVKINSQFAEMEKWDKMEAISLYPLLKEAKYGGVVPVKDPTEIPDPSMEYKLLFELVQANPDSVKSEINGGLQEVARVINLHAASGIPQKKIIPVIVVHGSALSAICNNVYFNSKFKIDNPNIKLINELKGIGAKFIACGQAMAFFDYKKEDFVPDVKISLTAQTVLSSYQLKGFVLYSMAPSGK